MRERQSDYMMPEGTTTAGRMGGPCLGHRIEIEAPPELVWDFIADFEGWDGWNPLYIETAGRAEPGSRISFVVKLEGLKPRKGAARIVTVRPNELLEYAIASFGGLLKIFRFIEIEEISPTRCAVTNGEIMSGPMGPILRRAIGSKAGIGLEAMNHALRKVAELKWSGRPDTRP